MNQPAETISILVHFYANLKSIVGMPEMSIQIPYGLTVRQLLAQLQRDLPTGNQLMRYIINEKTHQLHPIVKIVLNKKFLDQKTALDTPLTQDQSTLGLFPPVAGG